jgi:hypothetical protein
MCNERVFLNILYSTRRLTTGCTVRGSNPCGKQIFYIHPDWPWGPPSLLYNGYRVVPQEVKRLGRGVNHPPLCSAEVNERVELYLYSPSVPSWQVTGWNVPSLVSFTVQNTFMVYLLSFFYVMMLSVARIV